MNQLSEKTILDWALEYYRKGLNVIRVYYKGKCPPKGGEWERYEKERVTEEQLHEWFGPESSYCNISAVTGPISGGLTMVDFDSEKAYRWWAERNPELAAELPTSISGRGYHIFFRSELNKDDTFSYQEIDIKAKGLVALPPSMHNSGKRYEWIIPLPDNVSELPLLNPYDWNLEEFTDGIDGKEGNDGNEGVGKGCVRLKVEGFSYETQAAIEEAIKRTLPTAYGQRYANIFLCCRILKKIDEIKDKSWEEIMIIGDVWHERALPNIEHKSLVMTQARFKNSWEDARYPVGDGRSLEIAKEEAFNSIMPMPELENFKGDELMEKIIRLCFSLQKLAGPDDDWFIPTNKAWELFGISHSWLALLLGELQIKKIIKKTRKYTKFKCSRYRFIGPSIALLCKDTDCPGGTPL